MNRISEELLNKLVSAGYFLSHKHAIDSSFLHLDGTMTTLSSGYPYSPSLSDLIQALDNIPFSLDWETDNTVNGMWNAWAFPKSARKHGVAADGSTPEEAVANLWLALHEN